MGSPTSTGTEAEPPELLPEFDPASFDDAEARRFRRAVRARFAAHARSFPWRETADPWAVLLSEIMLQKTQTDRVLPKYRDFLARWPKPLDLAEASLAELLAAWSGLGYNRRALALRDAARAIAESGFPSDEVGLRALPGVGAYTARAVLCFARGEPLALMETNIRSVFLHVFFRREEGVADSRIMPLAEKALDRRDPRTWNWALMDLGAAIKKRLGNPNRRAAGYAKQGSFADSHRRVRGAVLRALGDPDAAGGLSREALHGRLPFSRERLDRAVDELMREGFLAEDAGIVAVGR